METRREYSAEFKREAVELSNAADKPIAQIARELGIRPRLLYKWREQMREQKGEAFPGHGNRPESSAEAVRLEREVARLRQELEILKKALAIFSRAP